VGQLLAAIEGAVSDREAGVTDRPTEWINLHLDTPQS